MKLKYYCCLILILFALLSCNSSKIVFERPDSSIEYKDYLDQPIDELLGKNVSIFINSLNRKYYDFQFTDSRPGVISSVILNIDSRAKSFFVLKMKRSSKLDRINLKRDWTIEYVSNEIINEIQLVDQKGKVLHYSL